MSLGQELLFGVVSPSNPDTFAPCCSARNLSWTNTPSQVCEQGARLSQGIAPILAMLLEQKSRLFHAHINYAAA